MADTIRLQIMRAVKQAINGAGKPAGLTVHSNRRRAVNKDQLPAVVVYPRREPVESADQEDSVERKLLLACEARVASVDETADEKLEPILAWIEKSAVADPELGGLSIDVQVKGTEWDFEEADRQYGAAAVIVEIDYVTKRDNAEQLG